jgi:hypothetical protein
MSWPRCGLKNARYCSNSDPGPIRRAAGDGYDIAISRRGAPEVMRSAFALSKAEGAGKAGCP